MLKEVQERQSKNVAAPPKPLQATGFPQAKRRVMSNHAKPASRFEKDQTKTADGLHSEIDNENQAVLSIMSEEEIQEEREKLMSMLGGDMVDFLLKRQGGPAPSRADKSVRFNEQVDFSNPPSQSPSPPPARHPILLPSSEGNMGDWLQDSTSTVAPDPLYDEGTPEDIRNRYFPTEPMSASLNWMNDSEAKATESSRGRIVTFDMQGRGSYTEELADHSGSSHRHADSKRAFSVVELLQLSRSAVAGQRSMALEIIRKAFNAMEEQPVEAQKDLIKADTVNQVFAACTLVLGEKHLSVVIPALSVLQIYSNAPPTRLNSVAAALTTDPPLLPALNRLLSPSTSTVELPDTSLQDILSIIASLTTTEEDFVSAEVLEVPDLLENLCKQFLELPWPPSKYKPIPQFILVDVLASIASRTRINAETVILRGLEQSTMRYLAIPPWTVEGHEEQAFQLASSTLRLLYEYAGYGLGCSRLSSSRSIFRGIESWINKNALVNIPFSAAWFQLLGAWSRCAIDPHSTTPEHDILWAETADWGDHALDVLFQMPEESPITLSSAILHMLIDWADGAKKHDPSVFDGFKTRLAQEHFGLLPRLLEQALMEPITAEKGQLLLQLKEFVNEVGLQEQMGRNAGLLARIEVEQAEEPGKPEKETLDTEGWI
jgi:hypothetical protein